MFTAIGTPPKLSTYRNFPDKFAHLKYEIGQMAHWQAEKQADKQEVFKSFS